MASFLQSSLQMLVLLTNDFLSLLGLSSIAEGDSIPGEADIGCNNALDDVYCLLEDKSIAFLFVLTSFMSLLVLQLTLYDFGVDCSANDLFSKYVCPFAVTHICAAYDSTYFYYCEKLLCTLLKCGGESFTCITPNSEAFGCNADGCQNEAEAKDENELNGEIWSRLVLFCACVFLTSWCFLLLLLFSLFTSALSILLHDCATFYMC